MRACVIIMVGLVAFAASPALAIDCQMRKGDGYPWAWRQIDGKRCWYKGRSGIDRKKLRWPAAKAKAKAARPVAVERPKAVEQPKITEGRRRRPSIMVLDETWPDIALPIVAPAPAPPTFEERWCSPCIRGDWWLQR